MIEGNVYINRQAVSEAEWFGYGNASVAWIMVYLILSANYKDTARAKRGEVITSLGAFGKPGMIMADLGLSVDVVRNSLKVLEKLGEIKVVSKSGRHGGTRISVVNYDKYTAVKDKPNNAVKGKTETKNTAEEDDGTLSMEEINEMFPD